MSIEDVSIPSDVIAEAKRFAVETRRINVAVIETKFTLKPNQTKPNQTKTKQKQKQNKTNE